MNFEWLAYSLRLLIANYRGQPEFTRGNFVLKKRKVSGSLRPEILLGSRDVLAFSSGKPSSVFPLPAASPYTLLYFSWSHQICFYGRVRLSQSSQIYIVSFPSPSMTKEQIKALLHILGRSPYPLGSERHPCLVSLSGVWTWILGF